MALSCYPSTSNQPSTSCGLPPPPPPATPPSPTTHAQPQITRNPRDPIAFLYYSIVLTFLTVIVAIVIGILQLLTMILNVTEGTGRFWEGVETAGEYYDVIGGAICGLFIIFGGLSVLVYPYWRRWIMGKKGREGHVRGQGTGGGRMDYGTVGTDALAGSSVSGNRGQIDVKSPPGGTKKGSSPV